MIGAAAWIALFGNIVRSKRGTDTDAPYEADSVTLSAVFGGTARRVTSGAFRGGTVRAVMGGVDLDLTGITLSEPPAVIAVNAFMGGVRIRVPKGTSIELDVSTLMAGVADKRDDAAIVNEQPPDLVITGRITMAGIDISD